WPSAYHIVIPFFSLQNLRVVRAVRRLYILVRWPQYCHENDRSLRSPEDWRRGIFGRQPTGDIGKYWPLRFGRESIWSRQEIYRRKAFPVGNLLFSKSTINKAESREIRPAAQRTESRQSFPVFQHIDLPSVGPFIVDHLIIDVFTAIRSHHFDIILSFSPL